MAELTDAEQRTIGDLLLARYRGASLNRNDLATQQYVEDLAHTLKTASGISGGTYVVLIPDRSMNAFAAPGGVMGVNRGLFTFSNTEAEFASVVAHEISHVTENHHARAPLNSRDRSPATALGVLAGILLGGALGGISGGIGGVLAATAGGIESSLSFTRLLEEEADRAGIRVLINANYDAHSAYLVFSRLGLYQDELTEAQEYLRTHPLSRNRIANLQRLATLDAPRDTLPIVDRIEFQIAKLRATAGYLRAQGLRAKGQVWMNEPLNNDYRALAHLAFGIQYTFTGEYEKASEAAKRADQLLPATNILGRFTAAEIAYLAKENDASLAILNEILDSKRGYLPAILLKSTIMFEREQYQDVVNYLEPRVANLKHPPPELLRLLTESYGLLDKWLEQLQVEAKLHIETASYAQALSTLKRLNSAAANSFEISQGALAQMEQVRERMETEARLLGRRR